MARQPERPARPWWLVPLIVVLAFFGVVFVVRTGHRRRRRGLHLPRGGGPDRGRHLLLHDEEVRAYWAWSVLQNSGLDTPRIPDPTRGRPIGPPRVPLPPRPRCRPPPRPAPVPAEALDQRDGAHAGGRVVEHLARHDEHGDTDLGGQRDDAPDHLALEALGVEEAFAGDRPDRPPPCCSARSSSSATTSNPLTSAAPSTCSPPASPPAAPPPSTARTSTP